MSKKKKNFVFCASLHFFLLVVDNVSVMLRHVFESHQASQPIEKLFQAAAIGDTSILEQVS